MKAIIVNSGTGTRIGAEKSGHPKCMTALDEHTSIVSRQLAMLADAGIGEVVMTTGLFAERLEEYCLSLQLPLRLTFVYNPDFRTTNYIYSLYLAKEYLDDDVLFLHGDLVFEERVLSALLCPDADGTDRAFPEKKRIAPGSRVTVSSTMPVTEKDFKALLSTDGSIDKIGVQFVTDSICLQPLYKIDRADWRVWLREIASFCESGERTVYAENAFNWISAGCRLMPLDVKDLLCAEIDDPHDLEEVKRRLC